MAPRADDVERPPALLRFWFGLRWRGVERVPPVLFSPLAVFVPLIPARIAVTFCEPVEPPARDVRTLYERVERDLQESLRTL